MNEFETQIGFKATEANYRAGDFVCQYESKQLHKAASK